MKSFKYVVTDPVGIHARPAGNLVKEIKKYDSDVRSVAATRLLMRMLFLHSFRLTFDICERCEQHREVK